MVRVCENLYSGYAFSKYYIVVHFLWQCISDGAGQVLTQASIPVTIFSDLYLYVFLERASLM